MQEHKKPEALLSSKAKQPEFEKVHVEPVDDILLELTAAAMEPMDVSMPMYVDLLKKHKGKREFGPCPIANCSCEPCLRRDCKGCWVEQTRAMVGDNDFRTRELIDQYRNRGW